MSVNVYAHSPRLFVVVHEDFFQRGLFDGQIGNLYSADLLQHRVDVTFEEEIDRTIFRLHIGDSWQVKGGRGETLRFNVELLIVVLLQATDIGDLGNLALANDADARAQALDFAQNVGGEENGDTAGVLLADEVEEITLHERVEAGGGLIEEEQLGAMQQALHDADFLLVAVGEVADAAVHLKLHDVGQLFDTLGAVAIEETGGILEQVFDLHAFIIIDFRRQVTDVTADLRTLLGHIFAEDLAAAAGGMDQRQEQADGGGFAGAVRSNEAKNLALLHLERDIHNTA